MSLMLSHHSIWRIKPSELKFKPEPEILGRGTFGLVVLAEYRGTNVAVKRGESLFREGCPVKFY